MAGGLTWPAVFYCEYAPAHWAVVLSQPSEVVAGHWHHLPIVHMLTIRPPPAALPPVAGQFPVGRPNGAACDGPGAGCSGTFRRAAGALHTTLAYMWLYLTSAYTGILWHPAPRMSSYLMWYHGRVRGRPRLILDTGSESARIRSALGQYSCTL
jgi:hypothetical protein